ncbi:MAG: hypothetical protein SPK32_00225 [Bacteroidaceae bacterium]|nr:hypothetical protein [Bacteroidaceae bacterium]
MKISNQTATQINQILDELIKRYSPGTDPCSMTDLSFQVNQETGELIVLDDRDDEIVGMTIDEWIDNQEEDFDDYVAQVLRKMILKRITELEALSIVKPYSFLLVDGNNETVTELYLVDEDEVVFEKQELMAGLEKDLDDFINRLMKE